MTLVQSGNQFDFCLWQKYLIFSKLKPTIQNFTASNPKYSVPAPRRHDYCSPNIPFLLDEQGERSSNEQ